MRALPIQMARQAVQMLSWIISLAQRGTSGLFVMSGNFIHCMEADS